ncbi:PTS sugar transporter subunit IIB [Sporosarcina sp. ANT_H38]|uniref:PTS sugar transporter subunit IIB n=1 Tax=Sporosarcina sp. ANT_H38 TaxID=2597358 RepID=UPI0011F19805|nr:PTS sugar transporter subunit IIB [Sporosarcina sp. ANT_H38]KAA0965523.1 PTS sugar transporter subunit IIB [Sporosarcina sp. ANT_H38]
MRILAVCGNGLGTSFILSMNVNKALKELNIDAECKNMDLASAKSESADYYIGTPEIMEQLQDGNRKTIGIINMVSADEIQKALTSHILGEK